jgi:hypothetical protein
VIKHEVKKSMLLVVEASADDDLGAGQRWMRAQTTVMFDVSIAGLAVGHPSGRGPIGLHLDQAEHYSGLSISRGWNPAK